MTAIYVGLGSNIRPREHIARALALLSDRFGPLRRSQAYRCPAVGFDGPEFINLVVALDSALTVDEIQAALQAIERDCGRGETGREGSRTMDLDLLLFGDMVCARDGLRLPRADIMKYAFVLRPLAELAPDSRHPTCGTSFATLWADFDDRGQPLTPIALDD